MRSRYLLLPLILVVILLTVWLTKPASAPSTVPADSKTVAVPSSDHVSKVSVPPLAELPERLVTGLTLTIEDLAKKHPPDLRSSRLFALFVPKGSPASPFIPAGPFRATWEGLITVSLRSDYTFSADGAGKLSVTINDAKVLDASGDDLSKVEGKTVQLKKGKNPVRVVYESPENGDAAIRLFWASSDFAREPISTVDVSHNADATALRTARRVHEGRELYAKLRCAKCHDAGVTAKPGETMPELELDTPSLAEAGKRLNADWIAHWLSNPHALRGEATMPQVLRGPDAARDAADIAAYLTSLGGTNSAAATPDAEKVKAGGGLVHELGCVGCHTMPANEKMDPQRVPLRHVRDKWKPDALREFLKQPDKHYAWIRMPNFRFTDAELESVFAFVTGQPIEKKGDEIPPIKTPGDAAHGKALVENLGCVSCHTLPVDVKNALKVPALKNIANWTRGCMAESEASLGKAPNYFLTTEQRAALLAFAATDHSSLGRDVPPEFAERQINFLRCFACHRRDRVEDIWSRVDGETEALKVEHVDPNADPNTVNEAHLVEQIKPLLTWTGEKLKPEWMTQFIEGKIPYKPRPWLQARMPGFPRHAEGIARGMALQHGVGIVSAPEPAPNEELAEIGRKLAGKEGGFSCTQCHSVGTTAAIGVFEAPGINFAYVKSRLRKEYFLRWITEPLRVEPGTKMPRFGENGRTGLTDVFDGDAMKQFEAIWQYLLHGDQITAPEQ